jgi:Fungal specific transcription factor domain
MHEDISRLGRLLFGFKSGVPFDPGPWHFVEALRDPAAFHLMLSDSAHHVASLEGHHPSELAILHKLNGTRLVNQRLSNPTMAICDGNILAVMFMTFIEVSPISLTKLSPRIQETL